MKGVRQLRGRNARCAVVAAACAVGLGVAPPPASADTYVDDVNGVDDDSVNDCLTPATACKSIGFGVMFVQTETDTVHVESGTYTNFNLPRGISVVADEFNANSADPRPVIDGDGTGPAVNVTTAAPPPGMIDGFVINGEYSSMDIADSITVQNNLFNEDDPATRPTLDLGPNVLVTGGTVTFRNNTFDDPLPIDAQEGIAVGGGSVTVENNSFDGLREAVSAFGVLDLTITGNTITGLHEAQLPPEDPPPDPPEPPTFAPGIGLVAADSSSTITDNLIHQPALGGDLYGVYLADTDPSTNPDSNAELRRNRVFDHDFGVYVQGGPGDISFEGDLLANNSSFGLSFPNFDPTPVPASITNATIYGNGQDIELSGVALTMDSTAVEDPIAVPLADSTCAITNSRGPTTTGDPCETFQTNAAPGFVNPSLNDFHLLPSSPLIDAGNPTAPPGGSVDFDGDGRAIDGNCDGAARRDIGADEAVRDCTPPPPPPPPDPSDTTPPDTKIKKGPKGRTKDQTPTFKFTANEPNVTFRCRLDKQTYGRCDRKETFHANIRRHVVSVYAVDSAGNRDPTPAKRIFRVIGRR